MPIILASTDLVEEEKVADSAVFAGELSDKVCEMEVLNLTCGGISVDPYQETRKKKRVHWFTELCLLIF